MAARVDESGAIDGTGDMARPGYARDELIVTPDFQITAFQSQHA